MVRMSENRIAASSGKRARGCSVTSQASSGVRTSVLKSFARLRVARYSGRYRPAWRIIQTGVTSTGPRSSARRKRSFLTAALSEGAGDVILDLLRGLAWVFRVADRPADHDVVGAGLHRRRRRHHAFLVGVGLVVHRSDAGRHADQAA